MTKIEIVDERLRRTRAARGRAGMRRDTALEKLLTEKSYCLWKELERLKRDRKDTK
jgi:hypothetical protein